MAHGPDITPGAGREIVPGSVRGAEGYFRVAHAATGQWTLLDPAGAPFFVKAVADVRSDAPDSDRIPAKHPSVRLREWGFNAVAGVGDGSGRDDGLPYFATVNLCAALPMILAPGIRVPDIFTPDWAHLAATHAAAVCEAHAAATQLVAWLPDEGLSWGDPSRGHPGLLQVCLSLEPTFAAYHAAWEFVLASHGGSLDVVAAAWSTPLANKELVREHTRAEQAFTTRGYTRDDQRWTREFARRYFRGAVAAVRSADANHLIASCQFASHPSPAVIAAAYPAVDVTWVPWVDLPARGDAPGAVIAGDVSPTDLLTEKSGDPRPARGPRLTTVETLVRRVRSGLRRVARHPSVVGYSWRQWSDTPGEIPPFSSGLVHTGDIEALTNVELAGEFNTRAEALRRAAAKQLTL